MEYGICMQVTVSVREMPTRKSQMVNQLLFGDLFLIKAEKGEWCLIETIDDGYEGWVYKIQVREIGESFFNEASRAKRHFVHSHCGRVRYGDQLLPVSRGAQFPLWKDDGTFYVEGEEYYYKKAVYAAPEHPTGHSITDLAKSYLETPYLWGGRSPFGIDGSGFIQIVFKMNGIFLPCDAAQQVSKGEQILFVEASKPGDLAFFENSEGAITHVGIILGGSKIIHAWGKVRIDTIDHQGIFNKQLGKYTHRLRVVKRLLA